jgi:hypothetical protein
MKSAAKTILGAGIAALIAWPATAQPKFGPDAVPMVKDYDYLRQSAAPDYWALSPFYAGQPTARGSSAAAAAMAANALRGMPRDADDTILSPAGLLELVADKVWTAAVSEGGGDTNFNDLRTFLQEAMGAVGMAGAAIAANAPAEGDQSALENFRAALAVNERSTRDVMIVQFDRGVATSANPGLTVAPVAAYDAQADRVLVMDTDRARYVPYWVPATTLLVAMTSPATVGALAGQRGGYLVITRP